jgi:hypothetical protein
VSDSGFEALAAVVSGLPPVPSSAEHGALPLQDAARILGSYRWIERRLFQVYGGWVAHEAVDEARVFYDVQSQEHAWHADLWEERLPVLDGVDPDALTIPPTVGVDSMLNAVAGGVTPGDLPTGTTGEAPAVNAGSGGTLLRLVSMARVVLPRLVAGYTRHLRAAGPVADASVIRALRLVLRDEIEAWQAAELQVQALVHRASDVSAVTDRQRLLEGLVADDGPGLVPWPTVLGATTTVEPPADGATPSSAL